MRLILEIRRQIALSLISLLIGREVAVEFGCPDLAENGRGRTDLARPHTPINMPKDAMWAPRQKGAFLKHVETVANLLNITNPGIQNATGGWEGNRDAKLLRRRD